jgi:hypothetical protein
MSKPVVVRRAVGFLFAMVCLAGLGPLCSAQTSKSAATEPPENPGLIRQSE